MRAKLFLFIPLVLGAICFTGCTKDGCTDENAINYDADAKSDDGSCVYDANDTTSNVTIHAHAKLGTDDFAFDTEVTNWEGRKMKFNLAQMYVSNFEFHDDEGGSFMLDDSYLLLKAGTMMYDLGEVPNGHYHGFGFTVGVDSVANHSDPATWPSNHALSSNNPDHAFWSWNSGYIFVKVEGMVDTTVDMSGTANAPFIYHIGLDMLATDVMLMSHGEVDSDVTYNLDIDYLKLFDNIDLRQDPDSHTMNNMPAAQALIANVPDAISMQ